MDCEKFEATLIDELYDELDELTSAAAKRHVAGCARCSALFGGLKATRRLAVLPMVTPPADLEDRILAAARDAQKVVPMDRRLSRAISWAGSWAMRPQTAMAALFLLMIGFSAVYLRSKTASAPSSANMTITAEGSPAAAAPIAAPAEVAKVDPTAAAAAHGVLSPPAAPPAALAMASAAPSPPPPASTNGVDLDRKADDGQGLGGAVAMNGPGRARSAYGQTSGGGGAGGSFDGIANAGPVAGAPAPLTHATQATKPSPVSSEPLAAAEPGDLPSESKVARREQQKAPSPLESAIALYNASDFDDATRAFDALAPGDPEAALWAARSVRSGQGGCAAAIPRFDAVASRSFGSRTGFDAVLEGGQCLRSMGSNEQARQHFFRLLTVPSYANRAQAAIDSLSQGQVAARKAPPPAPAKAAAPTKQAPGSAPIATGTTPPTQQTPSQQPSQQQQTPSPKAVSF